MAHEIENMFSVRQTPWHGLGHIVQDAPTVHEAIRLAGLNWTVSRRPVMVVNPDGTQTEAVGYKSIVRDSDESIFGILSEDYTPLQNSEAFEFFNPFVEKGLATFETAGSLRGGRNVWILAKLNKAPIEVGKGDAVNKYLLLSNGHDGGMAVRIGFTPIRVVCANTLAISHNSKDSRLIRVMHSKSVGQRVEQLQEVINAADARFEATAEQYKELSKHNVNKKDLEKYVEIVFGLQDERKELAKDRMMADITRLFETGRGQDLKAAKGTYWGLYNAVTEYLSYERGRSEDTRLFSLWFADAARTNDKALHTALEMVG